MTEETAVKNTITTTLELTADEMETCDIAAIPDHLTFTGVEARPFIPLIQAIQYCRERQNTKHSKI